MTRTRDPLRARLNDLTLQDSYRLGQRLKRLKSGDEKARERLERDVERAVERVDKRRAAVPRITYPESLPVSARHDDLLAAIRDHQVVVVAGETGSGKTTQLPKICLELGRGIKGTIAHTQPRRIAARTVAERIADELKVPLGEAVGFAVRFSDRSREDTLLRLMTDGLLLAEIQHDRLLRRYDTIIIDEAHERSLNIDFLLGYLKRILPARPDLKVIVTSATIDPERFAAHFDDAPIVEVSGRTYPVEVRYREPEDDVDQTDAIGDAVEELLRERPGDILVFLSGEREIRDTADALEGRLRSDIEILPLFARQSTAAQQRVWKAHSNRRVVLATNVAETSLTVPGIHYVVDPGTARISRYSARLKVQRLPIEPISQASADQRKGRCGRTTDGIAIRLYSEENFTERPRFTDPEILRTSLAAVILQMAAIDLGDVEDFPFLDPPDRRQVRDGIALLQELNALDESGRKLTPLGRKLANLPIDPRMGRMVLEADRLGCTEELIVIAAALSIQDVRERPADQQAQADQAHARHADETSDFLAYLNLWRYLHEQRRELSVNQFRKQSKGEFLHYLRIREWQDLVGQIRQAAKQVGIKINHTHAEPDVIHQAILTGLLSHLGLRDAARREYQGARNARFALWPGSGVKGNPSWVMVAELVETSRLWGRTAAKIDPRWVEPLAEHLIRRTYEEPRWERKRASVVATERVTLYGLPIVAGRAVAYGKLDPVLSRDLFIRRALVEGEWDTRHRFVQRNAALVEEVRELEERARRRDILVDDQTLYDFYAARIPDTIVSGAHFDRWWRDERKVRPDLLTFTRELLINPAAAEDVRGRPDTWIQDENELQLTYRFEPGSAHDGVTVHVPLKTLPQLRAEGFDWLVPALRAELVTALIRSLPKELRKRLVPVPDVAAKVLENLEPRKRPLLEALASEIEAQRGVRIEPTDWDVGRLPDHLRMTFSVEDEQGRRIAAGQDLSALREQVRPKLRAALAQATRKLERTGQTTWTFGKIPKVVALPGTGQAIRAYPSLIDEGATVGLRALESAEAQRVNMRAGMRRLLTLTIPSPAKAYQAKLGNQAALALLEAPHASVSAVLEDASTAAITALMGEPVFDEASFEQVRLHVAGHVSGVMARIIADVVRILQAAREVRRLLDGLHGAAFDAVRHDVSSQIGRLVFPGFISATGAKRLGDVERYLRGAAWRLDRLTRNAAIDRDRMAVVHQLEDEYARVRDGGANGELAEVPWLIEELRVSFFAQAIGPKGQPTPKRIRRILEDAAK
ncbi:ATP-dependent RNA helicase HrpA [Solirubrobacter soli]|uniref:ATP-dependent RNA helicase HrpA n=1 Tax=Solirubrobacter soli TaxID=363832 RepID=UPI0003FF082A|nr:ATP-dependent RNA helicase HrpA [Solirubrobacter soli]